MSNHHLKLIETPPEDRLQAWLHELYGKPVTITGREVLRHRDLSFVARLTFCDAIPETLIYKVVLPPWDVEQDLHERVLIPSVSSSARLYLTGHFEDSTAMFLEDLGRVSLLDACQGEAPMQVGTELAKLHRAFTYRIPEISGSGILRELLPRDYPALARTMGDELANWNIGRNEHNRELLDGLSNSLRETLATEPVSLVHGDLYAENILCSGDRIYIIDWSWFTTIGVAILDLATLASDHVKNGPLSRRADAVVEAYCQEYSRDHFEVEARLPAARTLSRFLFLQWLVERRRRGIMGTTVGPVDSLMLDVLAELEQASSELRG